MEPSKILSGFNSAQFTEVYCGVCGAQAFIAPNAKDCICTYCEAYLAPGMQKSGYSQQFGAVHELIRQGKVDDAAKALDAIDPGTDPVRHYALSSMYSCLSDMRYADVSYALPGFMHQNADSRNDEYDKNPNNSMRLLSRSKELLFHAIYIINDQLKSNDAALLYIEFMSEIKLDRHAKAAKLLEKLNTVTGNELQASYANMVYAVETGGEEADAYLSDLLARKELPSLYYLARHLVSKKELAHAGKVLRLLGGKANMPRALRLLKKIEAVEEATRL